MKNKNFIQGIEILARYIPANQMDQHSVGALHEQIYFCDEEWVTDPKDRAKLEELGWFVDEDAWSCFT